MKPTFTLFYTESVNSDRNSVCRIITVPVVDGVRKEPQSIVVNPEAPFDFTVSGISEADVEAAPLFSDSWPEIAGMLKAPLVCASEGNSAKCLSGTLERLEFPPVRIPFVNAKGICRRAMQEVSYSLDYLAGKYLDRIPDESDPVAIAVAWADLVVKALECREESDLSGFTEQAKILPGVISSKGYVPAECRRVRTKADLSDADVKEGADKNHPLYGASVVFTGKMESMSRDDARRAVIYLGGVAPERLTKDTDFLVVGRQDLRVVGEKGLSGKMKKAAEYKGKGSPVEIITESDFLEMIDG